jgi:hypothetical protein
MLCVFVGLIMLIGFLCASTVVPELGVEAFFNGKRVASADHADPGRLGA